MPRFLLLAAGLLVLVTGAAAQTPPPLPPTPTRAPASNAQYKPPGVQRADPLPGVYESLPPTSPALPALTHQPAASVPAVKTLEDLIRDLQAVQAERAKLEKREADLKAAVRKKLDELHQEVDKLGVDPGAGTRATKLTRPAVMGLLKIEGFGKTDVPKVVAILEKAGLQNGQTIQYPAIENARAWLDQAGFKNAEVVVVPNELPSDIRDIQVRAASEGDR